MATCKFCGKSIVWLKDGRKNIPAEEDGALHQCEEFQKSRKSMRTLKPVDLSPEEITRYEQSINSRKK